MKQIAILLFFTCSMNIKGQSIEDIGKISLSVVIPDNVDELDDSQLSKLQSKVMHVTTSAGFAGVGYDHNFVIYPKFAVYDVQMSESGMQNVYVATTDVSLFIKQVETNVVFSSVSKQVKGSGRTKEMAITNAIFNISVSDPQFASFIEIGKSKILEYYNLKCQDIILKSKSLVKTQSYEEAIALLMTVPDAAGCYSKVLDEAVLAFTAYQNQRCKELIQGAHAALEGNDYSQSLQLLSQIDPSSVCAKESLALMKSAGTKVDAEEKRHWDFAMRAYSDSVLLEKMRINAIKEIAVAYYRSQPTTLNYLYIIK